MRQSDLEIVGMEEPEVGTQKSSIPRMHSQCCINFIAAKPQECGSLQPTVTHIPLLRIAMKNYEYHRIGELAKQLEKQKLNPG